MKSYTTLKGKQGYLLMPMLLLSLQASADPLNGGMDESIGFFLALFGIVVAIITTGLVLSIKSYRARQKAPGVVAWGFVALSKAISIVVQYIAYSWLGFVGLVGLPANVSIIFMLAAVERHLSGRQFLASVVIRSALTYIVVSYPLFYSIRLQRFGFYDAHFSVGLNTLLLSAIITWSVYRVLMVSHTKSIVVNGVGQPILWSVMTGIAIHLIIGSYVITTELSTLLQKPELLGRVVLGVFPYNVFSIGAWLVSGAIAYGLYAGKQKSAGG
jgi:hypothetical protein